MAGAKPVKRSIALALRPVGQTGLVLLVRRPEDDEDFPGMWGLPAASCRPGETPEQAAVRAGFQKLGTQVEVQAVLATGAQRRSEYTLEMTLFQGRLGGDDPHLPRGDDGPGGPTLYTDWRWGPPEDLRESAGKGSLCSQLLLESRQVDSPGRLVR